MHPIAPLIAGLIAQRIVILDGAMGTMIQRLGLDEAGFRGRQFASHPRDLRGSNDLLSLTQPAAIEQIHRDFLEAGADILSTNTFNSRATECKTARRKGMRLRDAERWLAANLGYEPD